MRTPIVAFGLGITLAATTATGLPGQTPPAEAPAEAPPETPAPFCWRGQPLPVCRSFAIFELEGSYAVASTSIVNETSGSSYESPAFENQLNWHLGAMRNVSADWALGATVSLGTGSPGPFTGIRVRARRWLKPRLSAEFEAGAVHTGINDDPRYGSGFGWGPTLGARLDLADRFSLFARWEGVYAHAGSDAYFHRDAGFHQGLYLGASADSTLALAGTAVLAALGLIGGILLINSDF